MTEDLCEYAGECLLYKKVLGRKDEDSVLQISEICQNSAIRIRESCYTNMRDKKLNKWVNKLAG